MPAKRAITSSNPLDVLTELEDISQEYYLLNKRTCIWCNLLWATGSCASLDHRKSVVHEL